MLPSLHIDGFRCFRTLTIDRLARVNLFVGLNNAGKTSVLDAAEILLEGGDLSIFQRQAERRGEILGAPSESDIRHLFHGHRLAHGAAFDIRTRIDMPPAVRCSLSMLPEGVEAEEEMGLYVDSPLGSRRRPLSALGGLPFQVTAREDTDLLFGGKGGKPCLFLTAKAIDTEALGAFWDDMTLTRGRRWVVDALRLIEPDIEEIDFARPRKMPRRSFLVKLDGIDDGLPLGSLGDGIRRILALALHLDRAAGGALLADDIDAGLHYSVMVRTWRLLVEAAARLDVQVFATTHSLDCIQALAELCERSPELGADILLHRIDKGAERATTYNAGDLRVAVSQQMEVRGHGAEGQ